MNLFFFLLLVLMLDICSANCGTTYISPTLPMKMNEMNQSVPGINNQIYSPSDSAPTINAPAGNINILPILNKDEKQNNSQPDRPIFNLKSTHGQDSDVENGNINDFFDTSNTHIKKLVNEYTGTIKIHKLNKGSKIMYRVLDNLGVPMFINIDDPLEPSLRADLENNKDKFKNDSNNLNNSSSSNTNTQQIQPPANQTPANQNPANRIHIPASELEGTNNEEPK